MWLKLLECHHECSTRSIYRPVTGQLGAIFVRACVHACVCVHTHVVACTCLPACGKLAVATWPLSGKDAMVILCLVQHLAPSVFLFPSFASHIFLFSHSAFLPPHAWCSVTQNVISYNSLIFIQKLFLLVSELFTDKLKPTCCCKALVILPMRSAGQSKAAPIRLMKKGIKKRNDQRLNLNASMVQPGRIQTSAFLSRGFSYVPVLSWKTGGRARAGVMTESCKPTRYTDTDVFVKVNWSCFARADRNRCVRKSTSTWTSRGRDGGGTTIRGESTWSRFALS